MRRPLNLIFLDRTGFAPGQRRLDAARLRFGQVSVPCRIGRTGITRLKREGDGATPAGTLRAIRGFWRADRRFPAPSGLPMRPIAARDGWCDAAGHRSYNRLVTTPFAASHEDLMRKDHVYDVVVELDWNRLPRRQGRGSAIFLHLTNDADGPTAGCIAVPRRFIALILGCLTRQTRLVIR